MTPREYLNDERDPRAVFTSPVHVPLPGLTITGGLSMTAEGPAGGVVIQDRYLDWALDLVENCLIEHAQYAAQVMAWPKDTDKAVHLMAIVSSQVAGGRHTFAMNEVDRWVPKWPTEATDSAIATLCDRGFASVTGLRGQRSERIVTFRR